MNKTALWIGSFIIGGLLLALAAVLWLGGCDWFDSQLRTIANKGPVSVASGPLPDIPVVADRFDAFVDTVSELPLRGVVQELRDTMNTMRAPLVIANETVGTAGQELGVVGAQASRTLKATANAPVQVQVGAKGALDAVTQLADTAQGTLLAAQRALLHTVVGANQAADSARLAMARVAEIATPDTALRIDLKRAVADLGQPARGLRDCSGLLQEQPNAILFGRRHSSEKPTP